VNASGVKQFLAWARENFRWVVIDAPPVLPAADVAELLPLADGALLVIRAQSTPRELSRRAFDILGTHLHGVIFNAATVDSNPYYGYLDPHQAAGTKRTSPVRTVTGSKEK
jgi:Mrp family chromosome partitioning ATPase